ncbi:MAG TPA: SPOR domain-containing protein [Ferrovibrio sp.]|uniref:SPOR domain-containing protein n=1 Tax=Ferrovibrio sp. TaxID=1917215 RepID=UPI002ED606F6
MRPRKTITAVIALVAVAAFGVSIWFAYDQGVKRGSSGAPPLIRADQGPVKVAPENPGGLQVPNQDKEIYERIGGNTAQSTGAAQPERLLPPPEQPKAPAQPQNTAVAPAGSNPSAVMVPTRPVNTVPNQTAAPSPTAASPAPATGKTAENPAAAAKPAADKQSDKQVAAAPAAAPMPASAASAGGSSKIQLASLKDQAQAQSTWTKLHKKYADILGDLTPSYEKVEIPNKGTFVRLQAGPLKDRAAAQALCQKLAAKNQGCIVVR